MIRTIIASAVAASIALAATAYVAFNAGKRSERADWIISENATLREQAKEITRQVTLVAKKQKEYNDAQAKINADAVRLRSTNRLRVQAEHAAAVERASAESCRTYASGINGLFETCRAEYIELGIEAARAASISKALDK